MLGLEYLYMDALAPQWQLGKYLINMTQGALGQTLQQLYEMYESKASDISFLLVLLLDIVCRWDESSQNKHIRPGLTSRSAKTHRGQEHLDSWADYLQFWLQLGIILKLLISSQAFHIVRVLSIKKKECLYIRPLTSFLQFTLSNIWSCEFKPRSLIIVTDTFPKPSYVHVFHTLTQIKSGFSSSPWNHCDCSSSDMLLVDLFCSHTQTPHICVKWL